LLLIPKIHIDSLADIKPKHSEIITYCIYKIPEIAKLVGLPGFKTIINTGREGGQVVDHIHFHILSGDFKNLI
jgi:histidine triad (HIT) family protein